MTGRSLATDLDMDALADEVRFVTTSTLHLDVFVKITYVLIPIAILRLRRSMHYWDHTHQDRTTVKDQLRT